MFYIKHTSLEVKLSDNFLTDVTTWIRIDGRDKWSDEVLWTIAGFSISEADSKITECEIEELIEVLENSGDIMSDEFYELPQYAENDAEYNVEVA